jgi:hypothetical protein
LPACDSRLLAALRLEGVIDFGHGLAIGILSHACDT